MTATNSPEAIRKQIAELQAQLEKLESIKAQRSEFEHWVRSKGHASVADFLAAAGYTAPHSPPHAAPPQGRLRKRLTPTERDAILAELRAGRHSGAEIAKRRGFSIATIQKLKKEAGLVALRPED